MILAAKRVRLERIIVRNTLYFAKDLQLAARCEELVIKQCVRNRWDMAELFKRFINVKHLSLSKVDSYLLCTLLTRGYLDLSQLLSYSYDSKADDQQLFNLFIHFSALPLLTSLQHLNLSFANSTSFYKKMRHLFLFVPQSLVTMRVNL